MKPLRRAQVNAHAEAERVGTAALEAKIEQLKVVLVGVVEEEPAVKQVE